MEEPPPAASLRSALIIFSTVPILLVYPFIQRYFIKESWLEVLKANHTEV